MLSRSILILTAYQLRVLQISSLVRWVAFSLCWQRGSFEAERGILKSKESGLGSPHTELTGACAWAPCVWKAITWSGQLSPQTKILKSKSIFLFGVQPHLAGNPVWIGMRLLIICTYFPLLLGSATELWMWSIRGAIPDPDKDIMEYIMNRSVTFLKSDKFRISKPIWPKHFDEWIVDLCLPCHLAGAFL